MPPLLLVLALANLVIGTGAFVVSGILEPIAADLGISVAAAGQATTAYALSTAVLAPLALVATGRWPRKRALQAALGVFALGNGVCALAPDLATLLAGRIVMGVGAMLTALAAGITVASVDAARRGPRAGQRLHRHQPQLRDRRAAGRLARVRIRLARADRAGVRTGGVDGCGGAACGVATTFVRRARASKARPEPWPCLPVAWTLALTLLYFTAIFCVFSYIGPVLRALNALSPEQLSITLMLFGLSGVAGTLIGGYANDHLGATRTLTTQLTVLGSMMALLPLTAGHPNATVAVLLVWGTAGFGMMAPQQSRLASIAPEQAPLLLSLNTSMLYAGSALGAALGGAASGALGFDKLSWLGVPLAALGLVTLAAESAQRRAAMASCRP